MLQSVCGSPAGTATEKIPAYTGRRNDDEADASAELSLLDEHFKRAVQPGLFTIMVGPSSVDTRSIRLEVIGSDHDGQAASGPSRPWTCPTRKCRRRSPVRESHWAGRGGCPASVVFN